MTGKQYKVVSTLGHCDAVPTHYVEFVGTLDGCRAFMDALPVAGDSDVCGHCGLPKSTVPFQSTAVIEEVTDDE